MMTSDIFNFHVFFHTHIGQRTQIYGNIFATAHILFTLQRIYLVIKSSYFWILLREQFYEKWTTNNLEKVVHNSNFVSWKYYPYRILLRLWVLELASVFWLANENGTYWKYQLITTHHNLTHAFWQAFPWQQANK